MKKLFILFAMLAVACHTKPTGNSSAAMQNDSTEVISNAPKAGDDQDEHGCKASAGYTWSVLKNECIRSFDQIKLLAIDTSGIHSSAAFLLFNADKSKAEVFMPGSKESVILDHSGNAWKNEILEIVEDNGFSIKQEGKIIYKSK